MITGVVNDEFEAVVPVTVVAAPGQKCEVSATIDTGFNGFLTLAPRDIAALELAILGHVTATLGDGTEARLAVYEAEVN